MMFASAYVNISIYTSRNSVLYVTLWLFVGILIIVFVSISIVFLFLWSANYNYYCEPLLGTYMDLFSLFTRLSHLIWIYVIIDLGLCYLLI
jgi:hypothetical protein